MQALLVSLISPKRNQMDKRLWRYGRVQVLEKSDDYLRVLIQPDNLCNAIKGLKMLHHHGHIRLLTIEIAEQPNTF